MSQMVYWGQQSRLSEWCRPITRFKLSSSDKSPPSAEPQANKLPRMVQRPTR